MLINKENINDFNIHDSKPKSIKKEDNNLTLLIDSTEWNNGINKLTFNNIKDIIFNNEHINLNILHIDKDECFLDLWIEKINNFNYYGLLLCNRMEKLFINCEVLDIEKVK